ncbi:hypothetical protein HYT84_04130 [Candidatus Micrarchaeota archaeon]|nr:hypothetical protein [Candidatus Micrarchaeota archaeon]
MTEFRSVMLNATEAKRLTFAPTENLNININVDDVKPAGEQLLLNFTYTVNYEPKAGYMKILGAVYLADKASELKRIADTWKKDHSLPKELTEPLLNVINMSAGINGVFIARALNLPPPLLPPRLELTKTGAKSPR